MSNSGGKINKPIKIIDIQQVLGEKSMKVGELVTSKNINLMSKHKPISYDSIAPLTEKQRQEANYGHSMPFYNSPMEAISAVMKGDNFRYLPPKKIFRMLDFDGYDHKATMWHPLDASANVAKGSSIAVEVLNLLKIFDLGTLSGYHPNSSDIHFGFVLSTSPFTTNTRRAYYYPCTGDITITDIDSNGKAMISTNDNAFLPNQTWYGYPIITTAKYPTGKMVLNPKNDGYWFPYPYSQQFKVNILESSANPDLHKITISTYDFGIDPPEQGAGIYELQYLDATFYNPSDRDIYIITDAVLTAFPNNITLNSQSGLIPKKGTKTLSLQSSPITFETISGMANVNITFWEKGNTKDKSTGVIRILEG